MSQQSPYACPNCGASVASGQRFCSNCGAVQEANVNNFTDRTPDNIETQATPDSLIAQGYTPTPPPPPPGAASYPSSSPTPSYTQYQQGQYQPAPPIAPPSYATPQKDSSGNVLRQFGCGIGIVILLALVVCGAAGYFVYNGIRGAVHTTSSTITTTTGGSVNNIDVTPTQAPITTNPVNATVKYATVTMNVVDVKQAQNLLDDTDSTQNGLVRVDLKEQGPVKGSASFYYSDSTRLILPDGTKVAPTGMKARVSPDVSVTRDNWLDFPVPTTVKASQTTLQLGTDTQAQVLVPLTNQPDVAKYQDKTANPNKQTTYDKLNWTVTQAVTSLSGDAKQADKGMLYLTVTMKVDNPTQQDYSRYWGDYIRLQAGDTTNSAEVLATDFPIGFPAGSSGKTGTLVFKVPDNAASYTLIFLPDTANQVSQATIPFQV